MRKLGKLFTTFIALSLGVGTLVGLEKGVFYEANAVATEITIDIGVDQSSKKNILGGLTISSGSIAAFGTAGAAILNGTEYSSVKSANVKSCTLRYTLPVDTKSVVVKTYTGVTAGNKTNSVNFKAYDKDSVLLKQENVSSVTQIDGAGNYATLASKLENALISSTLSANSNIKYVDVAYSSTGNLITSKLSFTFNGSSLNQLETPTGLTQENGYFEWDAVTNASSYLLEYDTKEIDVSADDCAYIDEDYHQGEHYYRVKAIGDGENYSNSEWSNILEWNDLVKLDAPANFKYQSGNLTWDAVDHASGYKVKIDSNDYVSATSPYSVSSLTPGPHTASVVAVGTGSYGDSDPSSTNWDTTPDTVVAKAANFDVTIGKTLDLTTCVTTTGYGNLSFESDSTAFTIDGTILTAGPSVASASTVTAHKGSASCTFTVTVKSFANDTGLVPGNYCISYQGNYISQIGQVAGTGTSGAASTSTDSAKALIFNFALVGDNTWEVKNNDKFLIIANTSTGIKYATDEPSHTLIIGWQNESNKTRYIRSDICNREFSWYESKNEIRSYGDDASDTHGMTLTPTDKYELSFDANGGGAEMASKEVLGGASVTIPECEFTAPALDKEFSCWKVTVDDSGTLLNKTYSVGDQPFTMPTNDVTLEAQWGDKTTKLSTPTNLTYDNDKTVSWDAVENATGYKVILDENPYTTVSTNSYSLATPVLPNITHNIQVSAISNDTAYRESDKASLEFTTPQGTLPDGDYKLVITGNDFSGSYPTSNTTKDIAIRTEDGLDTGFKKTIKYFDICKQTDIQFKNSKKAFIANNVEGDFEHVSNIVFLNSSGNPIEDTGLTTTYSVNSGDFRIDGSNTTIKIPIIEIYFTLGTYYENVTYKFMDGDGTTVLKEVKQKENLPVPTYDGKTPTKASDNYYTYAFDNSWSAGAKSEDNIIIMTPGFTATAIEYDITYVSDVTLPSNLNPRTYTCNDSIELKNPDNTTDYNFAGWFSDSERTQSCNEIEAGSYGNKTFYAKWVSRSTKYEVTYHKPDGVGGTAPSYDKSFDPNEEVTVLSGETLLKESYYVEKWNTKIDGTGVTYEIGSKFNISNNLDLYPVWEFDGDADVESMTTYVSIGYTYIRNETRSEKWSIVTDANQLRNNDEIVIVAANYDKSLSNVQNANNRKNADITKSGTGSESTVTIGDDTQILKLIKNGDNWNLYSETYYSGDTEKSGYLYAASSSANYLRTEDDIDENGNANWQITIGESNVASIVAQGANSRKVMQYNNASNLFSCYASASQDDFVIYKKTAGDTNYTFEQDKFKFRAAVTGLCDYVKDYNENHPNNPIDSYGIHVTINGEHGQDIFFNNDSKTYHETVVVNGEEVTLDYVVLNLGNAFTASGGNRLQDEITSSVFVVLHDGYRYDITGDIAKTTKSIEQYAEENKDGNEKLEQLYNDIQYFIAHLPTDDEE